MAVEAMRLYDEIGDRAYASTVAGWLAQALYELDRLDEAETWAGPAEQLGASDERATQMLWRQVEAKVVARRGEHAVAAAYPTSARCCRSPAAPTRQPPHSARLSFYERKENLVMAERTRARLAENSGITT